MDGGAAAAASPSDAPSPAAKRGNVPFQRVRPDEVEALNRAVQLRDNSYEGTFGSAGWGAKASEVLSRVRGKDFRHEKTKKKRGSYRGGVIDTNAVHSYKFVEDE
jgi:hypothetical protein